MGYFVKDPEERARFKKAYEETGDEAFRLLANLRIETHYIPFKCLDELG